MDLTTGEVWPQAALEYAEETGEEVDNDPGRRESARIRSTALPEVPQKHRWLRVRAGRSCLPWSSTIRLDVMASVSGAAGLR
jgi:hypothetical protein